MQHCNFRLSVSKYHYSWSMQRGFRFSVYLQNFFKVPTSLFFYIQFSYMVLPVVSLFIPVKCCYFVIAVFFLLSDHLAHPVYRINFIFTWNMQSCFLRVFFKTICSSCSTADILYSPMLCCASLRRSLYQYRIVRYIFLISKPIVRKLIFGSK